MSWQAKINRASLATLVGMACHFLYGYLTSSPFLTDRIAEWIMARTPSEWAVPLLELMGAWAKPFAATGGLATLGFLLWLSLPLRNQWAIAGSSVALIASLGWLVGYTSLSGLVSFLLPASCTLACLPAATPALSGRRRFLTSVAMSSGTVLVSTEAWLRNERFAARAVDPVPLFRWSVTPERQQWGNGLVRKPVTTVREFYVMSKNTVDPVVDPKSWRLRVRFDDRLIREFSYAELLSLPRQDRFVTLRCVSNTLKSDLMGTAAWSGIELNQLVQPKEVPREAIEMAVIGLDGHGDSLRIDYAFSGEPLFALGMNGETLSRNHGYPIRLLTPRYYGFKSIKWIDEIRFSSTPYIGTWPKLGFTKEPIIHTATFIDRIVPEGNLAKVGGVSFAGVRGIQKVEIRTDRGDWVSAEIEDRLSPFALTRWKGQLELSPGSEYVEARALDGDGKWQASTEHPLFPDGVSGPTRKRLPGA